LIWFFSSYFVGIYVIIVVVASETMQKIFLYLSHYVQGFTLVLFLLNSIVFIETMYYWISEVEFDNHRNEKAENMFDLASWEIIQTIPMAFYLGLCYLFLVESRAHYVTQDGSLSEFIISTYIATAEATITSWMATIDGWLITLYGWVYSILFVYLSPVAWLQ